MSTADDDYVEYDRDLMRSCVYGLWEMGEDGPEGHPPARRAACHARHRTPHPHIGAPGDRVHGTARSGVCGRTRDGPPPPGAKGVETDIEPRPGGEGAGRAPACEKCEPKGADHD